MALDFPSSPVPGDVHHGPQGVSWSWDGAKWANGQASGPPNGVIVAASPPTPAIDNSLWYDSTGGQLYVRYNDGNGPAQWVAASNIAGLANAASKTDMAASFHNTGRNIVHNSRFTITQRGTGVWSASADHLADRWIQFFGGGTVETTINPALDEFRAQIGDEDCTHMLYSDFAIGTGADYDVHLVQQNIENLRRLSGKTVIVSFYAAAANGLKLGVSLDQNFGDGGTPSALVPGTGQSVTLAGTFARYSMVFNIPGIAPGSTFGTNGNDKTQLSFWMAAGPGYDFRSGNIGVQTGAISLWGVQLEIAAPGQVSPSPLEKIDPLREIQQCQRFFQILVGSLNGWAEAGHNCAVSVSFVTMMRTTPNLVITNNASTNLTDFGTGPIQSGIWVAGMSVARAWFSINMTVECSADL
jgi:hypothetical protein